MSDWATCVAARAEMRAKLLVAYDASISGGFTPVEARLMIRGMIESTLHRFMWPVYELWLDEDRPL